MLATIASAMKAASRVQKPMMSAVPAASSAIGTTRANSGTPGFATVSMYHSLGGAADASHPSSRSARILLSRNHDSLSSPLKMRNAPSMTARMRRAYADAPPADAFFVVMAMSYESLRTQSCRMGLNTSSSNVSSSASA